MTFHHIQCDVGFAKSWESRPNDRWWLHARCGCIQWTTGIISHGTL